MIYFKLLWKPIALIAGFLFVRWLGWRDVRMRAKADNALGQVKRLQTREEIEDEIQGDVDLVARAKRIGLVRPE